MAIQINGFQCERCKSIYADQGAAEACEAHHIEPTVHEFRYVKGKALPDAIVVRYVRDNVTNEEWYLR